MPTNSKEHQPNEVESILLANGNSKIQNISSVEEGMAYLRWLENVESSQENTGLIAELKLRTQRKLGGIITASKKRKPIPTKIKRKVINRDRKCIVCGFDVHILLEHHHVIPVSQGGENSEQNVITLCPTCHAAAHKLNEKVSSEKLGSYVSCLSKKYSFDQITQLRSLCNL